MRQDLVGANYGLLHDKFPFGCSDDSPESCGSASNDVYHPLPVFWATLLWKKLMGTGVLNVTHNGPDPNLRVYAHCTPDAEPFSATVLLINVGSTPLIVNVPKPAAGSTSRV